MKFLKSICDFFKTVFPIHQIKWFRKRTNEKIRDEFAKKQAKKYIDALNTIPGIRMWITDMDRYDSFTVDKFGLAIRKTKSNGKGVWGYLEKVDFAVIGFPSICSLYKFLENGLDLNRIPSIVRDIHGDFIRSLDIPRYSSYSELQMKLALRALC